MNMIDTNVMAENAIVNPPEVTQSKKQETINPKLQRWIDFCELTANEVVEEYNYEAQFIKDAEDLKKAKAEKRLNARLRKMEVERKAILLAEAQESIAEARRKFESQPQIPYDYTSGPPTTINDLFRAEKAREELKALERERKDELYNEVMEKRAKEAGDDWPRIQAMMGDVRFDHIPKYLAWRKRIHSKGIFRGSNCKRKGIR